MKKTAKPTVEAEPEKVEAKEEKPKQEVQDTPAKAEPEKVEAEKKEDNNASGISLNIVGKIDLEPKPRQEKKKDKKPEKPDQPQEKKQEKPQQQKPVEKKKEEQVKVVPAKEEEKPAEPRVIRLEAPKLTGPTVLGTLELPVEKKGGKPGESKKKKRKRIMGGKPEGSSENPTGPNVNAGGNGKKSDGKGGKGQKPQGGDNANKKNQKDNAKLSKKDKKGKRE